MNVSTGDLAYVVGPEDPALNGAVVLVGPVAKVSDDVGMGIGFYPLPGAGHHWMCTSASADGSLPLTATRRSDGFKVVLCMDRLPIHDANLRRIAGPGVDMSVDTVREVTA